MNRIVDENIGNNAGEDFFFLSYIGAFWIELILILLIGVLHIYWDIIRCPILMEENRVFFSIKNIPYESVNSMGQKTEIYFY